MSRLNMTFSYHGGVFMIVLIVINAVTFLDRDRHWKFRNYIILAQSNDFVKSLMIKRNTFQIKHIPAFATGCDDNGSLHFTRFIYAPLIFFFLLNFVSLFLFQLMQFWYCFWGKKNRFKHVTVLQRYDKVPSDFRKTRKNVLLY